MSILSFLRRRTNQERAYDLQQMADSLHRKRSASQFDKLYVREASGDGFLIERRGDRSAPTLCATYRTAQDYIRKFYLRLMDGSGAPDDMFIDSLKAVTTKKDS